MNNLRFSRLRRLLLLACIAMISVAVLSNPAPSAAQTAYCGSTNFLINITLANGAKWSMCWEERANEGIVFRQVTYTTPAGTSRLVLYQANLAQIHVPYDDNSARYHDLSDYGLGGGNLDNLAAGDCLGGVRLVNNGKNVLCRKIENVGYAYKYYATQKQATALTLFSVSHIGQYNYVPQWRFYDDGSIEMAVGATGKLQKCTTNASYGWPLGNPYCQRGTSHTHNYYWRLDFDLGGFPNDAFQEIAFNGSGTSTRPMVSTLFTNETARQVSPTAFRGWRVKENTISNTDGHAISYELEPESSFTFRGPINEPWTANDVYLTQYNPCEKWVSHNPTAGGCGNGVTSFVNGQFVSDVVVWYGVSFHHLARDEDEQYMSAHWSSFRIVPRDWTATNPR